MKIKELPKHLRPRERLIEMGVENLKNTELLAILLRTGRQGKNVIELSQYILGKYSLHDILKLGYKDLQGISGIDASKACTLLAAFELTKRALDVSALSLPVIENALDATNYLADIRPHKKEHFVVLYLNARNQLMHKETVSIGTLNASIVHPREVFEPAIRLSAGQIILAHNHPSGNSEPSDADLLMTKRLIDAGKLIGIEVLDHVIVTKSEHTSIKNYIINQ